jgi:Coenzyme PQQ synthesis protein D (PqqD)
MAEITLQSRLALDPRVRFRRFENDGIVIHQKNAEAIVISEVATRLLEMTDGARTLQECAVAIGDEFDAAPDVIERDVVQFARELADLGVVAVQP